MSHPNPPTRPERRDGSAATTDSRPALATPAHGASSHAPWARPSEPIAQADGAA
jgi:hypothetical protein